MLHGHELRDQTYLNFVTPGWRTTDRRYRRQETVSARATGCAVKVEVLVAEAERGEEIRNKTND